MHQENRIARPRMLRQILAADIVLTGMTAVLMSAIPGLLHAWTGLPTMALRVAGLLLLAYVAWIVWLRAQPTRRGTWVMIAINLLYALDCLLAPLVLPSPLTWLGIGFLLTQSAVVTLLALLAGSALGPAPTMRHALE